jgi:vancomycin resistance protein YoaR
MLEYAIKNKIKEINLPVKKIYPQIKIPKNLQKLGIKKIISTGWSDFSGSSENRIYNINHSRKKFDGIIIKPQEIFSFNKILGQVNGQTGYKKELVIKGPDTIPEYGGGVCQVSSTLFRAIMLSGAPITERLNHSYSVKYYNPVGSDATIYPGVQDLKFVNNSNSHLMIQTYLEENILYFYLLGEKKLSNTVETFGPFITNYKPIPKTRFVPSKTLKDQEKLLISKEVQGFNVTWYRLLDNNLVETIFSKYQSRPKVYKVGGLKEEKRGSL